MLLNLSQLVKKYSMNLKGVLHVGAHHGNEHKTYKELNIQNISYFEPVKKNFQILKKRVSDEANLYNFALGNFEGTALMNIEKFNKGQSCSILEPHLHLSQYPQITFIKKESVKVKILSNLPINFTDYNFLNIDVQGYELEVLKGSDKILEYIDYIIVEVNKVEMYKNCPIVGEIDDYLKKFDFARKKTLWVDGFWGDALYIKKNKLIKS